MPVPLLIADADPAWSKRMGYFCSRHGHEVEMASGGLECLVKLRRSPSAVLVLDLGLPWGGGDGVLARLREEAAGRPLPVVLLTGTAPVDAVAPLLTAPVVGYLRKPIALNALLESVRAVAAQGQQPSGTAAVNLPPPAPVLDGKEAFLP
jgi:DNA-binding response OmpR family regulator